MDLPESDGPLRALDLLKALNEGGVDYVVVGGLAGQLHGSAYPTYDLDVAYARDRPNLERLAKVLVGLDVKLRGAPPDLPFQIDAQTLSNGANFTFESEYGWFDILGDIDGIKSYESLRSKAKFEDLDGTDVRVASIDHLISMKRAANRTKDRLMLEEYIVIADEQRKLAEREAGE